MLRCRQTHTRAKTRAVSQFEHNHESKEGGALKKGESNAPHANWTVASQNVLQTGSYVNGVQLQEKKVPEPAAKKQRAALAAALVSKIVSGLRRLHIFGLPPLGTFGDVELDLLPFL